MKADLVRALIKQIKALPRRHEVPTEHLSQFWYGVLQGLTPSDTRYSLHVIENVYVVGSNTMHAYWEIGDSSTVPFSIEVDLKHA